VGKPLRQADLVQALCRSIDPTATPIEPRVEHANTPSGQFGHSLRLLVAEDNIVNQRLIIQQLKKLGHSAEIAANGLEVVQAVQRAQFDVILMDCQMPEMDGYEASRIIKKDPNLSHLKIIAMTANAMQGDREKCLEAGMDDYLTKPTRVSELKKALMRCSPSTARAAGTRQGTRAALPIRG
jgi:CheY-like chemotaxis protein